MRVFGTIAPIVATLMLSAERPAPAPLPVVGKWQLDYSPTTCRLLASFGPDRDTVEISQADPRGKLRLSIVSRAMPPTNVVRRVAVWFDNPNHALLLQSAALPPVAGSRVLHMAEAEGLLEALKARGATGEPVVMSLSWAGHARSYQLGKTSSLLNALDGCMDDLVTSWGYDAAEQRAAMPPKPVTEPRSWVTDLDFPQALVRAGKTAGLNLRLQIDATGNVAGCQAQEIGGAKEFDELTCRLVRERGHYTPATAKDGRPIPSYVFLRADWR